MSPYEVLGLTSNATIDEVRQAYRRQASRWHPDRNQDDPEAANRFRDARAAYDEITKEPSQPEFFSFGDIFENLFRQQNMNLDIEFTLNLRLTQAALGGPIEVQMPTGQTVRFVLPERLTEGHLLRVSGQGHRFQSQVGDLVFKVHIEMPSTWTKQQKAHLQKLEDSLTGKASTRSTKKK